MNNIAPHPNPVWPCDSLIVADLSPYGMPDRWEQFWAQRVTDRTYVLSCVPFFTYGISLGDSVEVSSDCIIERVAQRNGHKTLRIAASSKANEEELHEPLSQWVKSTGLLYEFCSPGYLAVDLFPGFIDTPELLNIGYFVDSGEVSIERDE